MRKYLLSAVMALTFASPSLAQDAPAADDTPAWLKAVGNFVRDGIEPPRTAADLAREEEERRLKALYGAKAKPAPPTTDAKPAESDPVEAEPAPAEHHAAPAVPAPAPTPTVAAPAPAMAHPAAVKPAPAPPAAVAPAAAGPAPIPPPKARPRMVVPVIQPPPAPVAASDRIAGTATLDQAIKLGGPADLYGQRIRKPKQD